MSEFRPTRFEILPPVIKNLIIVNVLIFLGQQTAERMGSNWIDFTFALHSIHSEFFKPHQVVTYMFMHGGWAHIFFNMFALWMFGSTLENVWGAKRFLIFYVLCGIGAGLFQLGVQHIQFLQFMRELDGSAPFLDLARRQEMAIIINSGTVGASGAVFGCLAAFGYLFPNSWVYVYFFPMRAKWFVLLYAGLELYLGVQNASGDNVAHWAHLGGALVGLLLVIYWNRTNRKRFY